MALTIPQTKGIRVVNLLTDLADLEDQTEANAPIELSMLDLDQMEEDL